MRPGTIARRLAGGAPERELIATWRRMARNLRVLRGVQGQWQADIYEQCAIDLESALRFVPRETK